MTDSVDAPQADEALLQHQQQAYEEKINVLERRVTYLEQIIKVSHILNSTLELEPLLKIITQVAVELTHTEACSLLLYDEETELLKFVPATASAHSDQFLDIGVPLENSVAGWVFQKVRPILIRDVKNDERWNSVVDDVSEFETHSILGVPLKIKNNVIGVLELINKIDEIGFGQDDIQIATALATHAAIAIQNARLWDDLQKTYQNLSELDHFKMAFMDVISEDLKSPLRTILTQLTVVETQIEAFEQSEAVLPLFKLLVENAMQSRDLVDKMLNLRHIGPSATQLEISIFSMKELVRNILNEFDPLFKAKSLNLKKMLPDSDDPVNIEGDEAKIYRIISNLISNSLKFIDPGGVILIALTRSTQYIHIRVADTGPGINQEKQKQVLRTFYKKDAPLSKDFTDIGLGLPVVKSLVEAHNGQIKIDSILGKGSQFEVMLPISIDI